jgi:hypothetical protein
MAGSRHSDLPVFSPDDQPILVSKDEIRGAVTHGVDSFVRYIFCATGVGFNYDNLENLLNDTDKAFDRLATATRSVVVPHTWGLIDATYSAEAAIKRNATAPVVPKGFILGACVETIRETRPIADEDELRAIRQGITQVNHDPEGIFRWYDDGPQQFMQGSTVSLADGRILADLDLAFELRATDGGPSFEMRTASSIHN